ncbi:helix-turn-helix transcriptional regulator, partial [Burkholderia multivorans]|nr:helix-turn-helix transcriptional regulator [Burkholderia multivorans]
MPLPYPSADADVVDWQRALRACVDAFDAFASPSATVFYRLDASGEPADF